MDCRSRNVEERELFIVEGKSAMGSCVQARNPDFQAIIPVRGKIAQLPEGGATTRFSRTRSSPTCSRCMGCGVEVKSKANKDLATFDLSLLRCNKVIICTDADVDGFQIRTLILTMLYRLTPTLIREGPGLHRRDAPCMRSPARTIPTSLYDDREKTEVLAGLEGKKYTIQRSKGLGENDPEMMSLTTMNPATRRLVQVTPADAEDTSAHVRHSAGGQPQRPEGLHRRAWQPLPRDGGCQLTTETHSVSS